MSRLGGRLSLSPDSSGGPTPALVGVPPPAYKSGILLQQRERNSKKSYHDYVNDDYVLHTGSLAKVKGQSVIRSGLVSKRSAAFEEFVKGTHPVTQGSHGLGMIPPTLPSHNGISKSPFQLVANGSASGSLHSSAFHQLKQQQQTAMMISNYENYTPKSMSPYTQLTFKQVNNGYESVQVLASANAVTPTPPIQSALGSTYKSTIENKVKLLSQQKDPTYASNMHVRVPSQDSSIYSDTRTYINEVRPVAIASRGGIFRNPSKTQLQPRGQSSGQRQGGGSTAATQPAIPRSQVVQKVMEPSYSSLLQNQGEQNQAIYANFDFRSTSDSTEDEYTSPPSPVSSSYSELRAATRIPMGMPNMTSMNPSAMFYDSFYEPISDAKNGNHNAIHQHKPNFGIGGLGSHYDDNFGPCSKCLELIVGEGKGCSAMGRLYHIKCFTCHQCQCLLQGKPFYALDGKPFCETDYLNTLEKCCKCMKPILDRILRATGKPYHPSCFTCVVCGKSLDGIPFTVDATNAIHCIDDFHKRFAPKCSVCKDPIMPEAGVEETVRVVALDRSFHVSCYKCEDCGLKLSSEAEGRGCYPLDDHVLCKKCNTNRIRHLTQGIK